MPQKILVITRNLPPLVGGMEGLIWHCIESLKEVADIHVIGPPGCADLLPQGVTATEIPISPLPRFAFSAAWTALQLSRTIKPDLVFAGSGLTAPFALLGAKFSGAKSAVYLHGLDVEADSWLYQHLWVRSFRYLDRVLVNSAHTQSMTLQTKVSEQRVAKLHPGVALPDATQGTASRNAFRQRYGLAQQPLMLFIGRITARKGLAPFIEHALPGILRQLPDAKLLVIGEEPKLSAHKLSGQMTIIQKSLQSQGLENNVLFMGERNFDDPELSEAYFAADVHIFPVQQRPHDNEGFGMVAIEAAAHGLPTVAFAAGGVPDAVSDGLSGRLIQSGDYQGFAQATLGYLQSPPDKEWRQGCQKFAQQFAWPRFGEKLRAICESIISSEKREL